MLKPSVGDLGSAEDKRKNVTVHTLGRGIWWVGLFKIADFGDTTGMTRMSPELWQRIPPEAQVIFLEMAKTIKRLETRVEELERRLGQTPQNSSLPPSSRHPHAKPAPPKPKSKKKRGGQAGHSKHERALVPPRQVSETIVLKPTQCRRCGEHLRGSDGQPLRHQVWELPEIKPTITEYVRHRLQCDCCGTSTCAALPAGVPEHQSGPRLTAFVALLMAHFRQSRRRVGLFCETVLNTPCSAGLAVKLQNRATAALQPCYRELCAALPAAAVVNLDETGTRQQGKRSWIWVGATRTFTLFAIRLSRSASVVKQLLGETFEGTIVTDRYGAYNNYHKRQVCWAHLL
jgi:transposase